MEKSTSMIPPTKKLVNISDCREGQIAAEDIITNRGVFLLPQNTMLNAYIINQLINHGISQIYIF